MSGLTPKSRNNFLRLNENKTELASFLAKRITSLHPSELVCVTHCEHVLSNNNINRSGHCCCNHEEADTRIFVHVKRTTVRELKTSYTSTDTDVVVIAISMFEKLKKYKL